MSEAPTEGSKKPRSFVRQALILLASGLVLGAGSCAGFMETFGFNKPIASLFAAGFLAGVLLVLGTGLWALIRLLRDN